MDFRYAISIVLEAHLPFVREYSKEEDLTHSGEESRFFEYISETLLPLLEVFDRLENDHVPFRLSLAISPILCNMLDDEQLQKKYIAFLDKQIEFGRHELDRTAKLDSIAKQETVVKPVSSSKLDSIIRLTGITKPSNPVPQENISQNTSLNKLAQFYYDQAVERKFAYTERYEKNLLKALDFHKCRGKIEILGTCATHAFLPFLSHNSESLQAQMETPSSVFRRHFGSCSQGFWLPCLGWTSAIEPYLQAYNYSYAIIDSHGLLFGSPEPDKGCFYPIKTPNGTFVLARDLYALKKIEELAADELYRNNNRDAGYELPPETVNRFLSTEGGRSGTGYKYWAKQVSKANSQTGANTVYNANSQNSIYNPQAASEKVTEHARMYLENTIARLENVSNHMKETPISLYANNADNFGRFWHEGPLFIETLFRMASGYKEIKFLCPSEYIYKQKLSSFQVVSPEFSSGGNNGYAETWLDVSNDWIYRHLYRAMERMTELAERFPDDTGLKERALNQAAREILLAQSSDWPEFLYRQESTEYARNKAENALRNFTTIYESLGSNYISTEWLTNLERRHNIFPDINYRVFRRKK